MTALEKRKPSPLDIKNIHTLLRSMKGTEWEKTYGNKLSREALDALARTGGLESHVIDWLVGLDKMELYSIMHSNAKFNGNEAEAKQYLEAMVDEAIATGKSPEQIVADIERMLSDEQARELAEQIEEEVEADAKRKQHGMGGPGPFGSPSMGR